MPNGKETSTYHGPPDPEKEYSFGETYSPFGSESMRFTPEAGKSMELAVSDWLKTGGDVSKWGGRGSKLKDVLGVFRSTSRTYGEQESLYKEKGPGYAKKPGTSLHETGTAADIPESLAYFRNWLAESGQKYGWSQRKYGGTKDPVTGEMIGQTKHHFEYSKPVQSSEDLAMFAMQKPSESLF